MNSVISCQTQCRALPKLRTFQQFKDFYSHAPHTFKPLSFFQRKQISKFRLGMLQLRIETGRYFRIAAEDRICQTCNAGQVEDETHFLIYCNTYRQNRQQLFGNITDMDNFVALTDQDKLKFLLNDCSMVKNTSKFIAESFDYRSTII